MCFNNDYYSFDQGNVDYVHKCISMDIGQLVKSEIAQAMLVANTDICNRPFVIGISVLGLNELYKCWCVKTSHFFPVLF